MQTKVSFPESLYLDTTQLLESKRGSDKNTVHPGLPVDIAKLEQQIIQQLHESLFSGPIGEALETQQASLAEGENLQLVIQSEDSIIRNLPWEMLFGSPSMRRVTITRTFQANAEAFDGLRLPEPSAAPLKLLFVTALPENLSERGKELQIEDEQRKLIEAVGNLEATGDRRPKMVIEFLDVASLGEITAALQARRHDILHISGHGGFNEKVNQAVLHLENEDGDHLPTEAADFAEALRGQNSLRLVVLSACETAVVGPGGGMVEAVAAMGIPAVLGMRFTVGDAAAKLFTTHFYRHLAEGALIADALGRARSELWKAAQEWKETYPDHPRLGEWFTPVLYLNGPVGALVNPELPYRDVEDFYPRPLEGKRLIGSGFIGRKRQLIQMRKAFRAGRHVCIVGMGGMGKTTLAEAFAANYENGAYDAVILRGGTEIHEFGILNQIVLAYGRRHQGKDLKALRNVIENGEMPILNRLHYVIGQCLKDEKVILVLDNFEDLQDLSGGENARGIVSEGLRAFLGYLIGHCPAGCHLLFTTRYRIEGLPDAVEVVNLDKLSPAEQYRWVTYSRELRFVPAADRLAICKRLDGLPRAFQFLEALARNKKDFDWGNLEAELGKVEARVFENLMLERIYGLLSPELQRVFLVASVFFTRTPVGALVAVMDGEFEEEALRGYLGRLLDWGLCFWDSGEFWVHGITREWVEGADLGVQIQEIQKKAAVYFEGIESEQTWALAVKYFRLAGTIDLWGKVSLKYVRYCNFHGKIEIAFQLLDEIVQEVKDQEVLAQSFELKGQLLSQKARKKEALMYFEKALDLNRKLGRIRGQATNLHSIGGILKELGEYAQARVLLESAIELNQSLDDHGDLFPTLLSMSQIAFLERNLGLAERFLENCVNVNSARKNLEDEINIYLQRVNLLQVQGKYDLAYEYGIKAVNLAHQLGKTALESSANSILGNIEYAKSNLQGALEYWKRGLEIQEEIGNLSGRGISLNNLGLVYARHGEVENAIIYFEKAIDHHSSTGNLEEVINSYINIGEVCLRSSNLVRAAEYFGYAWNKSLEVGGKAVRAKVLRCHANLAIQKGDVKSARSILEEAFQIFQDLGEKAQMEEILNNLGLIAYDEGDNAYAIQFFGKALEIQDTIGNKAGMGFTLSNLGNCYSRLGYDSEAEDCYLRSLSLRREIGIPMELTGTLNNLGSFYVKLGKAELAIPYFVEAILILRKYRSPNLVVVEGNLANIRELLGGPRFNEILSVLNFTF